MKHSQMKRYKDLCEVPNSGSRDREGGNQTWRQWVRVGLSLFPTQGVYHLCTLQIDTLTQSWTQKQNDRQALMEHYGVDINRKRARVVIDSSLPHLMALEDDVLSTGVVLYHLKVRSWLTSSLPDR